MDRRTVKIFPNDNGGTTITVDGVDVSRFVNRDGVAVEYRNGLAYVWLPVSPSVLFGDVPDAVVNALVPADTAEVDQERLDEWADRLSVAAHNYDWLEVGLVVAEMTEDRSRDT